MVWDLTEFEKYKIFYIHNLSSHTYSTLLYSLIWVYNTCVLESFFCFVLLVSLCLFFRKQHIFQKRCCFFFGSPTSSTCGLDYLRVMLCFYGVYDHVALTMDDAFSLLSFSLHQSPYICTYNNDDDVRLDVKRKCAHSFQKHH